MRTHRRSIVLAPWSIGAPLSDPAQLVAVRMEAVLRGRVGTIVLDLVLEHADALTVIPGVVLDRAALVDRDRDVLIFPEGTPGGDSAAAALAERVLPLCEGIVLDAVPFGERVLRVADSPRFDAARAGGYYGAAPLTDALGRLAPYRAARRYARRLTVAIDAADAVGGWALLRGAASVGVVAARRDAAALAWYGEPPAASETPDVRIIDADAAPAPPAPWTIRVRGPQDASGADMAAGDADVALIAPLALDLAFSNDAADGAIVGSIAVEPPPLRDAPPELARYVAAGGSGGRIAIVVGRRDAETLPAADTDEAAALAAALRAEGFTVDVGLTAPIAEYDFVHVIGARDGLYAAELVASARAARVAVAVTAHEDGADVGGWWGAAVTRLSFDYAVDEAAFATYTDLLARRALEIGPIRAGTPYTPNPAAATARAAALRDADVVFVATEAEADVVRGRGRTGPIRIAAPMSAPSATDVRHLVGGQPFVLVDAPIGPEGNAASVARVAAHLGLPLVVTGPVVDAAYLELVRAVGGPDLVVLAGERSAADAAGLRARAAVVVDPAWVGWGPARGAAALLSGARLVLAQPLPFADVPLRRFDPANLGDLTRALGEAWDDAVRSPRSVGAEILGVLAPGIAIRTVLAGYAAAASPA
jgi:hypothetical protein